MLFSDIEGSTQLLSRLGKGYAESTVEQILAELMAQR